MAITDLVLFIQHLLHLSFPVSTFFQAADIQAPQNKL